MYSPPAFRWDDRAGALDFARAHNFATMITVADGAPVLTHLPVLIDAGGARLRAHVARANPHAAHIDGAPHLFVFSGPYAYVSPDWYKTEEDVPTWNYVAVHVSGKARAFTDEAEIDGVLSDLSDQHESSRHDLETGHFWTIDKLQPKDHARMRRAILAFEVDIETVEAKAKLSQNKKPDVAMSVVNALASAPGERERAVAVMMADLIAKRP